MNYCRGDLVAQDKIRNYSLVIRDGNEVRLPRAFDDMRFADIYFVINVPKVDATFTDFSIEKGEHVRCFKVRNDFIYQ